MYYQKSKNGWVLCELSDRNKSCEKYSLNADDADRVEELLAPVFGERMKKEHIMISYDNWSGVYIMNIPGFGSETSDKLIKEIFIYLSQRDI